MKNKATTFPELMIVLLIISLGLFVFAKMTVDYTKSVVMAKELFVLNSALQEKYQLLIAYRNKWLEKDFTQAGPSIITDWFNSGNYCVFFNNFTNRIELIPSTNCNYSFINGQTPKINYQIRIDVTGASTDITIKGEMPKFGLKSELKGSLTKWHPFFQ